jgi:hypothetical protein
MPITELRREAQARLKRLPSEDLPIANAFLAFLEAGASAAAGEQLPPETREVVASFKRSWQQTQADQVKPLSQLKWNRADA